MQKLLLLNIVGLTPRHVGALTPNLAALGRDGGVLPLGGIFPAVTMSAQASILTGLPPSGHGIVANGWLYRDTMEVRFWQQSRKLVQGRMFYEKAVQAGKKVAKLFWWFNQGSAAQYSLTPKPFYGCDGNKVFDVHGTPENFAPQMQQTLGNFPFYAFWGPESGVASSRWIGKAAEQTILQESPDLLMVYLPHLDYDLQRFGPVGEHLEKNLQNIDDIAGSLSNLARENGYGILVVSEYGISEVNMPVHVNRLLRREGLLVARPGPFGDVLDTFNCRAFAVSDHQVAHIYIKNREDVMPVKSLLEKEPGIGAVLAGRDRDEFELEHPRSGELIALAEKGSWFTWYYHLNDHDAPDFARTVDIHRKPGYDPAELFYNQEFKFPRLVAGSRLLRKKLGFRYKFDVISPDASLIRGSHGLPVDDPLDGPIFLSSFQPQSDQIDMYDVGNIALRYLGINV